MLDRYRSVLRAALVLCLFTGAGLASSAQTTVTTLTDEFAGSGGITLHPTSGDLYVANFGDAFGTDPANWGRDVKRVTPSGDVSEFATGFFVATGNDFASDGTTLLQVELGRGLVFKVNPDGTSEQWTAGLTNPVGIVAAADGGAFVAECGANAIRRIEPDGTNAVFAADLDFDCPNGLTMDSDGVLYTVNFRDGKIFRIDMGGTVSLLATGPGGGNGHVAYAVGHLFVADRGGHQILAVDIADGSIEVIAGSGEAGNDDGAASEASFRFPNGIAVTPDGSTIYVNSKVSDDPNELNPIVVRVISGVTVANEGRPEVEEQGLLPISPNPSRGATTIRYSLAAPSSVELTVHTLLGRRIAVLEASARTSGEHEVTWDGSDGSGRAVAAGTYICRLRTDEGRVYTRLLTLVN